MKKMTVLSALLSFVLLAGCGNAGGNNQDAGHGANHNEEHNQPDQHNEDGNHAGHGEEGEAAGDFRASFSFPAGSAQANEETELQVQITDAAGTPVAEFEENHEKLLHLIIVNEDLSYFRHIHPDFKGDGTFAIRTAFPAGGKYKWFADFKPAGQAAATWSEWVEVEGEPAEKTAVTPDAQLLKVVGDKEVELALSGTKANEEVTLTYEVRDAQTKEGIRDLEPYLGAIGHVVILSEDAEEYLHVHPLDEQATGPQAQFATVFPHSGNYKIWAQFQHKGEVFTVPFVVKVG